jgi:hypothetical protein
VVKHKVELWRGVIVGWEKIDNDDFIVTDRTSLTSKAYELKPEDQVRYQVILDAGDAHMHYSKRREPGDMSTATVNGTDLTPVENTR